MRTRLFAALLLMSAWLCAHAQPDPSLKYVEAGIPAASRVWLGEAYLQAAQVFGSGKVELPRYSDPQGALVIGRIVSLENLSFQRNTALPAQTRLVDALQMLQGANSIMQIYIKAADKLKPEAAHGDNYVREAAAVLAFLLRVATNTVDLVEEIKPTIAHDDKYAARMEALTKMSTGVTTMFSGAETALSETNIFSARDLSGVLEAMAATLPHLKSQFAPDYRVELRKKLESRRLVFTDPQDAANLESMIRELAN